MMGPRSLRWYHATSLTGRRRWTGVEWWVCVVFGLYVEKYRKSMNSPVLSLPTCSLAKVT